MNGDIYYTIGNDLPSWFFKLYQEVTGCKVTHTGIILNGYLYESSITLNGNVFIYGVRKSKIESEITNVMRFNRELTQNEVVKMEKYLNSVSRETYNTFKLINIVWLRWFKWLWKLIGWTPFSMVKYGLICSELVDKAYKSAGIDLIPDCNEDLTTPCDLFNSKNFTIGG